jgi:hypothetical protein
MPNTNSTGACKSEICLFFYPDRWDFQVSTQKAKSVICFAGNTIYVLGYVANNRRNRSSVSNIIQRLNWRPLADRRKDARLVMLYKIDRELVAINKENRLIPTGRKTFQVSTQKAKSFICFAGNTIYVLVPL